MADILLLGASGQVGFELMRTLTALGSVLAPRRRELDLSNGQAVRQYLADTRPGLIVNAAAWTAVDAAEEKAAEAERLNAQLPAQLAEYASANATRLIHYSSDYVYPGTGSQPWLETSDPCPLNQYGRTKLAGDQAIEQSGADYLIFRTSWVYSARGNNFMKTMLRLAQSKAELNIVADQIGAPTPARLVAQVTTLAIHSQLAKASTTWLPGAKPAGTASPRKSSAWRNRPAGRQPWALKILTPSQPATIQRRRSGR